MRDFKSLTLCEAAVEYWRASSFNDETQSQVAKNSAPHIETNVDCYRNSTYNLKMGQRGKMLNSSFANKLMLPLSFGLFMMLWSCATPIHNSFSKLELGDDKSIVLEQLGNPKHSVRRDSRDIWVYRYYRGENEYKRTLTFEVSKLTHISEEERVIDPVDILIENDLKNIADDKK